jgi:hypothetical protein
MPELRHQSDTIIACTVCGRRQDVRFGGCLASGWPKCCDYTMRLLRTEADIAAVTKRELEAQMERIHG